MKPSTSIKTWGPFDKGESVETEYIKIEKKSDLLLKKTISESKVAYIVCHHSNCWFVNPKFLSVSYPSQW